MNFTFVMTMLAIGFMRPFVTQKFIDELRAKDVGWEIGSLPENIRQEATPTRFKKSGLRFLQYRDVFLTSNTYPGTYSQPMPSSSLPPNFDLRTKLQNCTRPIVNQGSCNSCWAIVIANLLSDRFCLHGVNVSLSYQDILECATNNSCCEGGYASKGYQHMIEHGAIEEKCKSYDSQCGVCRSSTNCTRYKCKENSIWFSDKVEDIKRELMQNGPIGAVMRMYEDLTIYGGGVYYYKQGKYVGPHAVEILGWGTDTNGTQYWIARNSWGNLWGMGGDFFIKIGDCDINEFASSCKPLIE